MTVYQYNDDGRYLGPTEAQPSPLEPGQYLMPRNSTEDAPPEPGPKQAAYFRDNAWGIDVDPTALTLAEKIDAGLETRQPCTIVDGDAVRPATYDEQVALGDLTTAVAYSLKLRDCLLLRQAAYGLESDPIMAQYLRGEATKEEWLAKIEEIKVRFPKPVAV